MRSTSPSRKAARHPILEQPRRSSKAMSTPKAAAPKIAELVAMDAQARAAKAARLMEAGVTIFRPDTAVIDPDVEVGADTVIDPFVQLLGSTRIGSGCHIR